MPILIIRKGKAIVEEPRSLEPISGPIMDSMVRSLIEEHPNLLVAYYLICSYLYYHRDISIISDGLYDEICDTLRVHWDDVEHPHKHLIDRGALSSGSGYYLPENSFPGMTRAAACALVNSQWGTHLHADL
jgi:hypothetical protein